MGRCYRTYSLEEIDLIFINFFLELNESIIPCELLEKHLATIEMELVLGNKQDDEYRPIGLKISKDGEDVVVRVNVLKYKDEKIHFIWENVN